jgi:hypothetical protein
MNGPLLSTMTEAATTMVAVMIFSKTERYRHQITMLSCAAAQNRQQAPSHRNGERDGQADATRRHGGKMQRRGGEGEANQPENGITITAAVGGPPTRR